MSVPMSVPPSVPPNVPISVRLSLQMSLRPSLRTALLQAVQRPLHIARLQHRDVAELVRLNALADATEHALLPDLVAPRIDRRAARRYWAAQVFSRNARTFVALAGGRVVGMIGVDLKRARHRYAVLKRHTYLHSLFVLPAWRGAGVARQLIRHALQWSRRRDATLAALEMAAPNVAARRLYGSFGFAPREMRFTLALDGRTR
jgi:GNAT superfamily N-acetyltransferase